MEREFVPYELAMKLKALGFNESCFSYYSNSELVFNTHTNNEMQKFRYSAPTFSQAFRWFRDFFNIEITPVSVVQGDSKWYNISYILPDKDNRYDITNSYEKYDSHEEAELACLNKLIEIVESKSE